LVSDEGRDGLLQERHAGVEDPVLEHGVVGVARHEDHLHLGTKGREALGELPPAHAGQHHVRQQRSILAPCFSQMRSASPPLGAVEDHVARAAEDALGEGAHLLVVLDQEDGLFVQRALGRLDGEAAHRAAPRHLREVELERRPLPGSL
jgi:hypothetical protein